MERLHRRGVLRTLAALLGGSLLPFGQNALAAPSEPLRLVALGDTGMGNRGQRRVAEALRIVEEERGPIRFGLLLKDNAYPSGVTSADDPAWHEKV